MSWRERINKLYRGVRKKFDKDSINPIVVSQNQQKSGDLCLTAGEADELLDQTAVYSDLPDLELIDKVNCVSEHLNKGDR